MYLGSNCLINAIQVNSVREFEAEFLKLLELKHKHLLADLKKGIYTDEITTKLEALAKEIVVYRTMNNGIKDIADLTKIKGMPNEKIKIIALYLDF